MYYYLYYYVYYYLYYYVYYYLYWLDRDMDSRVTSSSSWGCVERSSNPLVILTDSKFFRM